MAAILTVQGGIIMQNRQIDGHGLYLSLLAGLAVGVYASPEDTAAVWQRDLTFEPQMEEHHRAQLLHGWHKAVERSLAWAKE